MAASAAPAPTTGDSALIRLPVTRSRTAQNAPHANSTHPNTAAMPRAPSESVIPNSSTLYEPDASSRNGILSGRASSIEGHGLVFETGLSRPEAREAGVLAREQCFPGPFRHHGA